MDNHEPTFLYVEDDMLSRRVMQVMLNSVLGYSKVELFENSANFLGRLHGLASPPDVIFLDVQIGPHDGYAMLEMLRGDPCLKDATVIAMTANVMSHDVDKLRKAGFSGLIGKPILKDIFPELVERICQARRSGTSPSRSSRSLRWFWKGNALS